MKKMGSMLVGLFKRQKQHHSNGKTYTDKDRIAYWAYNHCERENAKWIGTDPMNICPLGGKCPGCQEKAREAILTK